MTNIHARTVKVGNMRFTIVVDKNVYSDERGVTISTEHLDKGGYPYEQQTRKHFKLVEA